MKNIFTVLLIFIFSVLASAQITDRFSLMNEVSAEGYTKPLATAIGTGLNSGTYYSASVPSLFGFTFSLKGMMIFIPETDKTFDPFLPEGYEQGSTATIFGDKGNSYAGYDGFIALPPGINQSFVPLAYPQVSFATFGTELMIRYLPNIELSENKDLSFWGVGLKHSISQYIPLIPVDIAAQIFYNKFSITDLVDHKNIAFNVHASKTLGVLILYGGLQFESTSMDLEYEVDGNPSSADPLLRQDKKVNLSIDGNNNFRLTLGTALKLAFFALNVDVNIGSQVAVTSGLNFAF
jgi:hypothetical protein